MGEIDEKWTINEGMPDEEGDGDDNADVMNLMNMDNKDDGSDGKGSDLDIDDI